MLPLLLARLLCEGGFGLDWSFSWSLVVLWEVQDFFLYGFISSGRNRYWLRLLLKGLLLSCTDFLQRDGILTEHKGEGIFKGQRRSLVKSCVYSQSAKGELLKADFNLLEFKVPGFVSIAKHNFVHSCFLRRISNHNGFRLFLLHFGICLPLS